MPDQSHERQLVAAQEDALQRGGVQGYQERYLWYNQIARPILFVAFLKWLEHFLDVAPLEATAELKRQWAEYWPMMLLALTAVGMGAPEVTFPESKVDEYFDQIKVLASSPDEALKALAFFEQASKIFVLFQDEPYYSKASLQRTLFGWWQDAFASGEWLHGTTQSLFVDLSSLKDGYHHFPKEIVASGLLIPDERFRLTMNRFLFPTSHMTDKDYWQFYEQKGDAYVEAADLPLRTAVLSESLSYLWPFGSRLLDVGCGAGLLGQLVKDGNYPYVEKVIGLDYSKKMCQYADETGAYDHVILANGQQIPLPDRYCDGAVVAFVEHYLNYEQKKRLFAELKRVVDLGFIVIHLHHQSATWETQRRWNALLHEAGLDNVDYCDQTYILPSGATYETCYVRCYVG